MPELPEVETVRRGLEALTVGRRIVAVEVANPGSFMDDAGPPDSLVGARIEAVRRRAKLLMVDLADARTLLIHLKMTGQMVVVGVGRWGGGHPSDSLVEGLPDASTRVILTLCDGSRVFFNDQRKFGWMRLMAHDDVPRLPFVARLGPEPLEGGAAPEFLRRLRRHPRTSIKAALLNQEVVAGIGNIYADEALWAAKVHPATAVGSVSDRKARAILDAAIAVMAHSLELGGSTDRNYVDAQGNRGAYLEFAAVFRRDGQPCRRCGRLIVKTRVAGRGTHLCPRCQRPPRAP
ncbi:MAG: bifunctional DNA-formamidopyrimidine glycosylase/DNA-(apurinic or apyrimidinic site) lyase [Bifidobacteriaceae bacterium]|jgi:formamidopyrimidine-DNA glycosylase|nr:bifunctional DNA-formamidopyrimidine glycosylase/DNA-(apurinic or apyrimidinic site) lyase [Bifidobacteriaceae bacterium]